MEVMMLPSRKKKVQTDFCLICDKECDTPPGYNPLKHKFICSDRCKVIEQLFTTVYDDKVQAAMGMYQMWLKQTGGNGVASSP